MSSWPRPLLICLSMMGLALITFSLVQIGQLARDGQRYFEKADPVLDEIMTDSKDPFPRQVTLTEEQFTALALAKMGEPSTKVNATTLTLLFSLGVFLMVWTSSPFWRHPDRSAEPEE